MDCRPTVASTTQSPASTRVNPPRSTLLQIQEERSSAAAEITGDSIAPDGVDRATSSPDSSNWVTSSIGSSPTNAASPRDVIEPSSFPDLLRPLHPLPHSDDPAPDSVSPLAPRISLCSWNVGPESLSVPPLISKKKEPATTIPPRNVSIAPQARMNASRAESSAVDASRRNRMHTLTTTRSCRVTTLLKAFRSPP